MERLKNLRTAIDRSKGRLGEITKQEASALASLKEPGPRYRKASKTFEDGEKELGRLRTVVAKLRASLETGLDKVQEDYVWD